MLRSPFPLLRSSLLRAAVPHTVSRAYSAPAHRVAELDAGKLVVTKTQTPKAMLKPEELVFGRTFSGADPISPISLSSDPLPSPLSPPLPSLLTPSNPFFPPPLSSPPSTPPPPSDSR